jgi:hypothetical protein
MYHFLRRIHLFSGLILLVFVLMYFVSGYVIIHAKWFGGRQPKVSTYSQKIDLRPDLSDQALVSYFQAVLGLRGRPSPVEHRKDGTTRVNFSGPAASFQAVITPGTNQVTITRKDFGFAGVANGMHRLRGYSGGALYCIWSFMYDLASAALIVFGVTGVLLWYQSTPRRLPGWICLVAGFGFTAAMVLYLMLSD